jgi:excisionase family DNA binding protein
VNPVIVPEQPLTIPEVAVELRVASTTVRRWVANGQLKATRLGRSSGAHYRISPEALREFLQPVGEREEDDDAGA